jgi:uncharacterized membrane protein
VPAAILSALPVLILSFRRETAAAFSFEAVGLLSFVVALLITLLVNVPIDDRIKQWTIGTLPSDWEAVRDRWQLYHGIRTVASLGGLGCVFLSALLD